MQVSMQFESYKQRLEQVWKQFRIYYSDVDLFSDAFLCQNNSFDNTTL